MCSTEPFERIDRKAAFPQGSVRATLSFVSWEQAIGFAVALFIMLIGLFGAVLPGIPGAPLILLIAVGHRLYFGDAGASNLAIAGLLGLTLLSLALDFLASVMGAQKLGATWRGVLGAVMGLMAGMFFSLPGLILGPFLGALAAEMLGNRKFEDAARAGVGAMLGLLVGAVGKLSCAAAMIGIFVFSVLRASAIQ